MPKVKASIYFTSDYIDLQKLSQELQITPTKIRKKEEWPIQTKAAGMAVDMWKYSTDKVECKAVWKQVDKLQALFSPKVELIKALIQEYSLEANVTVVVDMEVGDGPAMVLTKENIQFLSQIEAEIGFDMYIDYEEEEDSCDELEY